MKLKKTVVKAPPGAATIADRFKLDAPDSAKAKASSSNSKETLVALVCGLAALAVSGILAYILYQHWEFLMPA